MVEVARVAVLLVEAVLAVSVVRMDSVDPKVVEWDKMVIQMVTSAVALVTTLLVAEAAGVASMLVIAAVTQVAIATALLVAGAVQTGRIVHIQSIVPHLLETTQHLETVQTVSETVPLNLMVVLVLSQSVMSQTNANSINLRSKN